MTSLTRQLSAPVLAVLLFLPAAAFGVENIASLSGQVVDPEGTAIPGATIIVLSEGEIVTGAATDDSGRFKFSFSPKDPTSLIIRISSVGYEQTFIDVQPGQDLLSLQVTLVPQSVEVPGMTISPKARQAVRPVNISRERIARQARMSLVATNPIAGIKEPEVSRSGSSHSSQLRVYGTNPVYFLNGLPIGTDPSHYGMFCFIPAPVVREIKFQGLGSGAKYRQPSVVEFQSPTPFGEKAGGEVNLSTIDFTGTLSAGGKRWYALGSLRKSVLDRLVETLQGSSDRTTLPPTNFQDVFGSVGFDLGGSVTLIVDQYHVRDYLKYNTSAITNTANGTITVQESSEDFAGTRLQALLGRVLLRGGGGVINERHQYHAVPENSTGIDPHLFVDLREDRKIGYGRLELDIDLDRTLVTLGVQSENDLRGRFEMEQLNWNFLSPFANTDNPFVYQQALNQTYAVSSGDMRGWNHGAYFSVSETVGRVTVEGGGRLDTYSQLVGSGEYSYRLRAAANLSDSAAIEVFHGTFSESPVDNILEAYQVLIRTSLDQLYPIKTELWSAGFNSGPFRIRAFNKLITKLPVPTPDFEKPLSESGAVRDDFIEMTSTGEARFWGGSISIDQPRFLSHRLSIYASYAYTRAHQIDNGVKTRYELDAPHKAQVQTDYRLSSAFSVGAELQVRSGYPFSPLRTQFIQDESRLYTESYYSRVIGEENSRRFPTHAYLNLNTACRLGNAEIFLSLSNVTNRANPIINAATGLIYDAGITPMLGMKVSF